jgi:hypothetical protein
MLRLARQRRRFARWRHDPINTLLPSFVAKVAPHRFLGHFRTHKIPATTAGMIFRIALRILPFATPRASVGSISAHLSAEGFWGTPFA